MKFIILLINQACRFLMINNAMHHRDDGLLDYEPGMQIIIGVVHIIICTRSKRLGHKIYYII